MKYSHYDYAVLGGDMRQVYLVEELAHHANRVLYYALCGIPDERHCSAEFVTAASSIEEMCNSAPCIICPIPFCGTKNRLNQSAFEEDLPAERILAELQEGQSFVAGCVPENFKEQAERKGVRVFDLMKDESLPFFNSIATAEGAVCEAIRRSPVNLHHSSCAVLGFGKCGSMITQYLKGMFCEVYVVTDPEDERAKAALIADQIGTIKEFESCVGNFDFIFNTIPAPVVTARLLSRMKSTVTIIDIASAPGGVDYIAARKLGVNAALCLGLPGKYAPSSSAKAVKETIERILKE